MTSTVLRLAIDVMKMRLVALFPVRRPDYAWQTSHSIKAAFGITTHRIM